jgi:hypothetical protein
MWVLLWVSLYTSETSLELKSSGQGISVFFIAVDF